jgi:hypothetical protein
VADQLHMQRPGLSRPVLSRADDPRWREPALTTGLGIAGGFFLISVVTALLVALGLHVDAASDLGVLAAATAVVAVLGSLPVALFAAGFSWLCLNGFLVDRLGVLRWHGLVDGGRLLTLVAVAVGVVIVRSVAVSAYCWNRARTGASCSDAVPGPAAWSPSGEPVRNDGDDRVGAGAQRGGEHKSTLVVK